MKQRSVRSAAFLLALVFTLMLASPAHSRELAVPPEDMVKVEIATLALSMGGAPVLLLREPNARKVVPIIIGPAEAEAILRARNNIEMPRPMTHDLFGPLFEAFDAELTRVFVDELADNTFLGALELIVAGRDEPLLIDSRPSDALAIAIRLGATIYVAPDVMEAAADIQYRGLDDEPVTAMGITVDVLTDDLREALDLAGRKGLLVTGVTGPARDQGLEPGDLIMEVNGEAPESPLKFLELVRDTDEGEKARIRYWQDGESRTMDVPTDVPTPQRQRYDTEGGISL